MEKKFKKNTKWLSEEALQIAVKRREAKSKGVMTTANVLYPLIHDLFYNICILKLKLLLLRQIK